MNGKKCWVKQLTHAQAEKLGISEPTPLEMVDYENPKTGEKSKVPAGIDPSFNHNFDRFTALLKLANDKHAKLFAEKLGNRLDNMVLELLTNDSAVNTVSFAGIVARPSEIDRLKMELDGTQSPSEGVVGDEYQQYFDVMLERYNPDIHKVLVKDKSADFAVMEVDKAPKEWTTIDFMLALEAHELDGMNQYLMDNRPKHQAKAWRGLESQILDHLAKSDIVPLDLRNLYLQNRIKLLNFLLSLSKEQQSRIVLITG